MTTANGTEKPTKTDLNGTARPPEAASGKKDSSSSSSSKTKTKRKRKRDTEASGNYLVKRKEDGRYVIQLVEDAIPEDKRSPARHDLTCEDCEKVKRRRRIEAKEREVKAAKREVKRRLRALGVTASQIR